MVNPTLVAFVYIGLASSVVLGAFFTAYLAGYAQVLSAHTQSKLNDVQSSIQSMSSIGDSLDALIAVPSPLTGAMPALRLGVDRALALDGFEPYLYQDSENAAVFVVAEIFRPVGDRVFTGLFDTTLAQDTLSSLDQTLAVVHTSLDAQSLPLFVFNLNAPYALIRAAAATSAELSGRHYLELSSSLLDVVGLAQASLV